MNTPNRYELAGDGIHVTYTHGHLVYRDEHQSRAFEGNDIRVVECDLGQLVSVTTRITTDAGSTSFTMLIPRAQVPGEQAIPIHTHGITVTHRFSVIPAINTGQLDTSAIVPLDGTASFVRGR